jgi:hypothetical protein
MEPDPVTHRDHHVGPNILEAIAYNVCPLMSMTCK